VFECEFCGSKTKKTKPYRDVVLLFGKTEVIKIIEPEEELNKNQTF